MGEMTRVFADAGDQHARGTRRRARRLLTAGAILGIVAILAVALAVGQLAGGPASQPGWPRPLRLVPAHGALFGAYVQPVDGFGISSQESAVTSLEHALGRKLAIDNLYARWAAPMPLAHAQWDLREGRIPMISWAGARTDLIAAGAYDAQIRARALQLKNLNGPVMLRWFGEMDGVQNQANAGSPASFIRAWRHIHDIFAAEGAANVRWVWCPTAYHFATGIAGQFYPGGAYVDWIGADGYSWAPKNPGAKWRTFAQIFTPFYRWGRASGKPMLIGEYGVLERAPGEKAAWFMQADLQLRTELPAIRAVVYFNSDHQHYNWKVTTSRSALEAFRSFAQDPYFSVRPSD